MIVPDFGVLEGPFLVAALEYAGELRAMQDNWPKIQFHALREHAGLVFQSKI